jgi:hypothetical protein
MPRVRDLAIAALLGVTAACTQFEVRTAGDPGFDVAGHPSWGWLPLDLSAPADQRLPDRHLERKLVTTVGRVLQEKGYREDATAPELFVNYRLSSRDHTDVELVPGYGIGAWTQRHSWDDTYERGTLRIDVIDAGTRTLVWRGTASARLLDHASYEKRAKRTEEVVRQVLETFPRRRS